MEIQIQFTRPKSFKLLSWVIQKVQGTPYSHVRLAWKTTSGVDIVYEAGGANVKFLGPAAQKLRPVTVVVSYTINLTQEQKAILVRLCIEYAGLQYGILQLLGIGVAQLFGLKRNPLSRGSNQQICSELVGRLLSSLHINTKKPYDLLSPLDIQQILEKERVEKFKEIKEI